MTIKKLALIAFSGVLLITGGTLLWQQLSKLIFRQAEDGNSISVILKKNDNNLGDFKPAFPADSLTRLTFQDNGQDRFDLLLVNYKDHEQQSLNALLFPKNSEESVMLPSSTGLRQSIWETTAETIANKAPKNALFLSWWDDGQRLHFLTGRDSWLNKPGAATFNSKFWQALKPELTVSVDKNNERLTKMARWLTMDGEQALTEIRAYFGNAKPLYLLVNNDLLMRLAEMSDYGGKPLVLSSNIVPASADLHNDISQIKRMTQENGDGNYLVQKEGGAYRVWMTPKQSALEKNSLLLRLLPFVESLKQLPVNIELVYQSHWGGYLSIYRINPAPVK